MLGAMRQEMTFARQQAHAGRAPGWLSVPVVLTSHARENGKNELSHQDTTLCEAWLAEPADRARVMFPQDANAAMACLEAGYGTQCEIWTIVAPKRPVPFRLSGQQARRLVADGMLRMAGSGGPEEILQLIAIGAYPLGEVLRASRRLVEAGMAHSVIVVNDPGCLRTPRDKAEALTTLSEQAINALFPTHSSARVIVCHTRTELVTGVLRRIDTGSRQTRTLGFINRGGTLDTFGCCLQTVAHGRTFLTPPPKQ